jgi:hypothetical protein
VFFKIELGKNHISKITKKKKFKKKLENKIDEKRR